MLRSLVSSGVAAVVLSAAVGGVQALNNGLGLTPQMGWNSWNYFHCNVSDALIRETAQAMVSSGLAEVGYNYINIDDCWQVSRDSTGRIVADPVAFPNGMAALADYVHSLGLKFGLYSDAGNYTCQMRPGGLGHEVIDAQTYAEWGVDYLKYDNCNNDNIDPKLRYPPMRDALNATGADIFFSMCEWGVEDPATWAGADGNSWRTTSDIANFWDSVMYNIDMNDKWAAYAGPGGWNDPDMLEVGNGALTQWEDEAHFSLWALAKAPLIIGCDLRSISESTLKTLSNQEVIALSQDPLGVQGSKQLSDAVSGFELWSGPLAEGDRSLAILNRGNATTYFSFSWAQSGAADGCWAVRDLWTHTPLGQFASGFSSTILVPHQVQLLRITPCGSGKPGFEIEGQKEPVKVALE